MKRLPVFLLSALILMVFCSCELMFDPPSQGKVNILVYGNDYYYDTETQSLGATVNDAVQVGLALSKLCEKTGRTYSCSYIYGSSTTLDSTVESMYSSTSLYTISHNITGDNLTSALTSLASSATEGDMTFIYLSGHGSSSLSGVKVDYGTDTSTTANFYVRSSMLGSSTTTLYVSSIMDMIETIPGVKVVFGDFCYSGSIVQSGYVSYSRSEYNNIDSLSLFDLRAEICEDSSLYCLSASRYNETSVEAGSHGYFTAALLKGLDWDESNGAVKIGSDNRITFYDLAVYVSKNDNYADQTPMFSGGSNDIILFSF